jgi:hypothetical protein
MPGAVLQTAIFPGDGVEGRLRAVLADREAIGRAVLASATELACVHGLADDARPIMFLLCARYYCKRIYEVAIGSELIGRDYADVSARVAQLRRLSPAGFGISDAFLDERWLAVPLAAFPVENPYREVISNFETLPYYICPIDFCVAWHERLKTLQGIASNRSFECLLRKGMVSAKWEHLLCLDDLVDISTVMLLLANPIPTIGVVLAFQPYVHGLEMAAELEFAFTSLTVIVERLMRLDIEKFLQAARAKVEAVLDVDTLLGGER